ncbi:MAG: ABC transporter permease [Ferruginibacter sp.]
MIRNYFKLAWRNIKKDKFFSFINIMGLSIGLTCCMLIAFFIMHEYSYDSYHKNGDRVYQLGTDFMDDGKETRKANTAAPIAGMMQQDFPEIEATARMMNLWRDDKTLFQLIDKTGNTKSFYEKGGYLADSSIFQILTFDFIEGNREKALDQPNSITISDEIAAKLFGKEPALDKTIHISSSTQGDHDYKITGVYKKLTAATHLNASFIMSFAGGEMNEFANDDPSPVNNNMFYSYLLLKKTANPKQLEAKFPAFVQAHIGEQLKGMGRKRNYFITPVKDIHLAGITDNFTTGGSKTTLFILASIAILTLLIACINFMNLSTAGSAKRAAEVGVRKVLGAQKNSLLWQFLGESMFMTFIALIIAFGLTYLLLPLFESVAGNSIQLQASQVYMLGIAFVVLALVTGLLAGSYPAFYLSSFKPIKVLKGKFSNSLAAVSLRKGMVVFQFIISVALIIASIVIADQMKFMRSKQLGFQKDQQLVIPLRTGTAKSVMPALRSELVKHADVKSAGAAMAYPGIFHPQDWSMYKEGQTKAESKKIYINLVDDQYMHTLDFKLIAGRLFSQDFPADTLTRFVINEEAVKQFGFHSAEEAVGKWLAFNVDGEPQKFTVIGVVKDFNFKDLRESIEPFAFRLDNNADFNYLVVNLSTHDPKKSLASIGQTWKKLNPNEPFEYSFLDLDFQSNYESETRQASLINYFTLIAIIISCLGLFGLASFTAEQRTKEIGIRKVLGATVSRLVALLSADFLKLVAVAVLIASPLAWYFMNKWLQHFAYRTIITWKVFAFTSLLAILIAFITISYQAIKTSLANPIKNLRTE